MYKTIATLSLAAALALLPAFVPASFARNLNYASPSRRHEHANLGVDTSRVVARRSTTPASASDTKRPSRRRRDGDEQLRFTHGVASGDPYADSVILWTRVAPSEDSDPGDAAVSGTVPLYGHDTESFVAAGPDPVCVEWRVWEFEEQGEGGTAGVVVASGEAYTTSDIDYTVKVEATGLQPFTTYNYQFKVCGFDVESPLGRTKTALQKDAGVSKIKLAVFSCSNYPNGYFNPYGNGARRDEHDYVVHLGDYIYEYQAGGEHASKPHAEIFTLHDYRTRHGQYRTDANLQLLSQNYAWIPTWDDHEISNNGYRDGSSGLNNTGGSFQNDGLGISVDQRKMNAVRAYFEWLPIRQVDLDDNLRIWRSFQLGNLVDLIILDTRNYDRSTTSLGWNNDYIDLIRNDAGRTLMGSHQENWFYNQLTASSERGATWRLVGSQIIFSAIKESYGLSGDNWNGYITNRNRTLKHLYDNKIDNTVFLAGDSHQNWVSEVARLGEKPYDPATGESTIGIEFAGTAVSSSGARSTIASAREAAQQRVENNTELLWNEGYYRGYFLLVAARDRLEARFHGSPSVTARQARDLPLANFTVLAGANRVSRPLAGGRSRGRPAQGGRDDAQQCVLGYRDRRLRCATPNCPLPLSTMDVDTKDVEAAEQQLKGMTHSEQHYFNSYNHHGIHEEMLKDEVRTKSYMNAIVQNKHLFKDKIVLDVGCGTGILSMFAVKAGAKHVVGVDMSTIVFKAREIVKVNGMADKITLIQGKMEEIEMPFPKVDIIISEWMGYFLLYESMLDTVLYARDKYLNKDGLIFPDKATIFMCGIEDGEYKDEKIGFWDNVYGFNYSPLKETALAEPLVDTVEVKAAVTDPTAVLTLDLYTCTTADLTFSVPFKLTARRDDFIHALVAWFDIDFTACHKPIRFSTGPHTKYTHWKQTVFYLNDVLTVQQGEEVGCTLVVKPNDKNRRDLDIKIEYLLDTQDSLRQAQGTCLYKMC
ncbi:hypothetical protein DL766_008693 [Monosporascus sp. MC13-8B]|nr:hypothetical protein DL766_008693 [Monosporascus sp. MC13-8B]